MVEWCTGPCFIIHGPPHFPTVYLIELWHSQIMTRTTLAEFLEVALEVSMLSSWWFVRPQCIIYPVDHSFLLLYKLLAFPGTLRGTWSHVSFNGTSLQLESSCLNWTLFCNVWTQPAWQRINLMAYKKQKIPHRSHSQSLAAVFKPFENNTLVKMGTKKTFENNHLENWLDPESADHRSNVY